ncbi:PilX N-terminal domain-containing pilus assembly protein [Polaromonas sp.]|uniref:pilus assembly PilX family protein n=1 Tax=Polaromonas sp. TaxID=1869339 RepID=UPI00248A7DD8|nr:PilX N-terminal domain-containing pilus assembly protein [Polaromonas sp.]MDI1339128.1 PilX N-terminal domain-containing pilus assembly protein [Polaromonas sp.]
MKPGMFRRSQPSSGHAEGGVALPVVLMFLLVITILGTLGIRRATTGETLSRNQLDYEVARQATEAALRDAERDLLLNASGIMPNALCSRGTDRPLGGALGSPAFDTNCPRGQCRFELSYYDSSNYTTVTNPEPWWPTINAKQGRWDGDPASAASPKPGDATGVNTNCTFNGSVPLGTFTGVARIAGVARQPEYLIEYLARADDKVMRVTARGFGADINTEVVMQTYFRPYLR